MDSLHPTDADRSRLPLVEENDLGLRPIYHRLDRRVEAHIFVAFLAYCLQVTLKNKLQIQAPGLTPTAVLEKLATIQLIDVWIPTCDGRWLVLPRYTQPAKDVEALLAKLNMALPAQPPPRITAPSSPPPPVPIAALALGWKKYPPANLPLARHLSRTRTKFNNLEPDCAAGAVTRTRLEKSGAQPDSQTPLPPHFRSTLTRGS